VVWLVDTHIAAARAGCIGLTALVAALKSEKCLKT
jgi:hypothetical protein